MAKAWQALIVVGLLIAAAGMLATFDGPFDHGWLGHNGARYSLIARNYLAHGLTWLDGAPRLDAGVPRKEHPVVYAHHPPAVAMVVAMAFDLAGVSENAARAVPALATLLALLLLARLVGRVAGPREAALTVLAAVAQPMVSIYGAHVDVQGMPVYCASLVVILAYLRWLRRGTIGALLLAALVASSFDWYGLYAPAACAAHLWFTQPARRAAALGLLLYTAALTALWLVWLLGLPGITAADLSTASGPRGPAALLAQSAELPRALSEWWTATRTLMPGWPLLLAVALAVLAGKLGRPTIADPPPDEPRRLGPRGLLGLLLLPPLVHGLLFPAGMLQHGYWLFALPFGLAFGLALALRPLRAPVALVAVLLLLPAGVAGARRLLDESDQIPVLMGRALAEHTAPPDVTLTNYAVNPFEQDVPGDAWLLMRPEVTFYSDRVVRGGLAQPADLDDALQRRPDATWFLLVPWPPPSPGLEAAVAARTEGEPLRLSGDPPVTLHRLRR